ncbi:helix-turn-helix domain-containing protein [Pedobacter gandavensis]|uniref:XRE family transcriptional regulator n=1 Tax=Pedobacter gandavensis TaxID=2679963 RepID=A0ABR6EZ89_9SPHI|nr:helix-turn-helix transcriptional regulator [Pedobacter gandavensis]MBB2150549.1 XRE family transcriptional regulator [Pedobacter gandavensis]
MKDSRNNQLKVHQGKNVKRFREMLGLRQEGLAEVMGAEWNQKRISLVEAKEVVEQQVLILVATALKIPVEVLENFTEEAAINYFNTFIDSANGTIQGDYGLSVVNNNTNPERYNLVDQLIEAMENLKMLYSKNTNLYERLLSVEKEKNEILSAKLG